MSGAVTPGGPGAPGGPGGPERPRGTGGAAGTAAPASTLQRAQALLDLGRPADAVELLHPLLAEDPGNAAAWGLLAMARLGLGDVPGALHATEEGLRAEPAHHTLWQLRALALGRAGRLDEAVAAGEEALRLEPESHRSHLLLARILAERPRQLPRALELARHAARLAPTEAEPHLVAGSLAHRLKRYPEAERGYRAALEVDPRNADAHTALGALWVSRLRTRRRMLGEAFQAFAGAAAEDATAEHSRFNIEAMLWNLAAFTRWIGLGCLFLGLIGAAASGAGTGTDPGTGALPPRLITLLLIAVVCGLWVLRLRRRIPATLHPMLLRVARHSGPVRTMAAASATPVLAGALLVAVPWSSPVMLPLTLLPTVAVVILCYWTTRRSLLRRVPR